MDAKMMARLVAATLLAESRMRSSTGFAPRAVFREARKAVEDIIQVETDEVLARAQVEGTDP